MNQNQRRVFLYNADDDAAADITLSFDENGSDPWCNIAIGIDPGYAACAGAVDAPDEDAYLRPRPFFEAMHQGASLGECFLYASPSICNCVISGILPFSSSWLLATALGCLLI